MNENSESKQSLIDKIILFCLKNKLVVFLLLVVFIGWGLLAAPFDWELGGLPRNPVPVDAIPDIGENQQIVFTEWPGRSPQDVDDQITYPLTVSLLGIPEVKTIRSQSMFGFSSIYIIFNEKADFYWSRSRILEKLNSLPTGTLPEGVQPALGPDATALGQIFWYTLEGRDKNVNPAGGWDLDELRSIQDWYVRYSLMSVEGISEVASVGGFVKEYQVDVDPDAMRAFGVGLDEIFLAVQRSNVDVGARTIEVNRVEYVIRGLGFIKNLDDMKKTVIKVYDNVPDRIKDVAHVTTGPALRRGALDKGGAEAVGGVVVVRYGYNPLQAIKNVKEKIKEIAPGLPKKTLTDGTVSQVTVVPFYDRTGLIYETLGTLETALTEEILVTIIVVIVLVMNLRSSVLISLMLPLAVLVCFIAMKVFGVDANIVALSGIAIAIGTIVDMGIILCENILNHIQEAGDDENRLEIVYRASREVGGAVLTAVATTIVGFLPVFTMVGAEGKLFRPLAFTKTFALVASIIIALTIIPPAAYMILRRRKKNNPVHRFNIRWSTFLNVVIILFVGLILTKHWLPLGPEKGVILNFIFIAIMIGGLLLFFYVFQRFYTTILSWCLNHKLIFLAIPILLILAGSGVWFGPDTLFGSIPQEYYLQELSSEDIRNLPTLDRFKYKLAELQGKTWEEPDWISEKSFLVKLRWTIANSWSGLGKEFMPPLDEGSFLYMPTTMPHASIGEALDVLQKQDIAFQSIPEIESVVGKIGRVESALDPAPISMVETVINYKSEYITDEDGHRLRFKYDKDKKDFVYDSEGNPIPDENGRPYRQWRDHIKSPDDIWDEIAKAGKIPGTTGAPKLQPIAARLVMLQSGMRAPMGIKIKGSDLKTIEKVGLEFERYLKQVPSVETSAVIADRIVGKPYLEIEIDRDAIARYGISIRRIQDVIEVAIGGRRITTTVEGRERYPVRVRYLRELRDDIESLGNILVPAADGSQIPLVQLTNLKNLDEVYRAGPQAIKSEDTFLVGYVLFDKKEGFAEVDVVEQCQRFLDEKIASGELNIPPGVSFSFAGTYENQVRAQKTLMLVVPLALFIIFMILYFQFKSTITSLLVFSGIIVAWSGGFVMIWLYGQGWFFNFDFLGVNLRQMFQMHPINLSVAIWVGFLALFGIASDDGVVMCTYLEQNFEDWKTGDVSDIRRKVIDAGKRRVRPCLMTTATTILALIPVLTSTGRGSDIMVPMAIPVFGGITIEVLTMLVVPVLYSSIKERKANS